MASATEQLHRLMSKDRFYPVFMVASLEQSCKQILKDEVQIREDYNL